MSEQGVNKVAYRKTTRYCKIDLSDVYTYEWSVEPNYDNYNKWISWLIKNYEDCMPMPLAVLS